MLETAGSSKVTQREGGAATGDDVWVLMAMNLNIKVTSMTVFV